ncbi:CBS domain-containing protein [Candidatus Gracilibacteria bacterium]|jgi:CBS domain-containing protein|nr:CBS domain-containing protein [Candidatus Gracilibacteria bacterium]
MLYLSHVLGAKVLDSADHVVGVLQDLAISHKVGEYAPVRFLVVKPVRAKKDVFIPYEYVDDFSKDEVSLTTSLKKVEFEKHISNRFVFLDKDVLDQQIVDVSGIRVVRVNDLRMGKVNGKMCVLGIDISTKGLLRRLKIEWMDFFNWFSVDMIDWRKAQPLRRELKLSMSSNDLDRLHPADLANIIEDLNVQHGGRLVQSLDVKDAAKVLEEIEPKLQKILVKYLGPDKASDILSQMSVDEVADLMKSLPREEAKVFLSHLRGSKMKNVEKLLIYPDDTAGGLMTLDFMKVSPETTVKQAMEEIRRHSSKHRSVLYIYIIDEDEKFKGVVSLRSLIVASAEKKMCDLTNEDDFHKNSTLKVEDDVDEIMEVMTKYDLFTAAVLDESGKLLGIVSIDDVMRHLVPNA